MKYVVPLAVLALVVAGFSYYTLFTGPDLNRLEVADVQPPTPATEAEPEVPERQSSSGAASMYELLSRGERLECAITYIPNPLEPEVMGTFFTSDGDFRGDFVVPTPDLSGQMVTSIIIAGGTIWQWTDIDGEVVGSQQPADFSPTTLDRLVSPIGLNTEVQYNCLTWPMVDNTIFEAPASVLFTDATAATFEDGVIFEEGEF